MEHDTPYAPLTANCPEQRAGVWARVLPIFSLLALAVLLYTGLPGVLPGILGHEFVNWDDPKYITENPFIRRLDIQGLGEIFTRFHFTDYLPFNLLSYAVDYHFWGLNPLGYHLTNIALHALNTVLVFALAGALGLPTRGAWLAAALFAAHPVNVESVAWASERKNLLSLAFFLAAFLCYLRYRAGFETRTNSPGPALRYLGAVFLFTLAVFSKSMAVTLPLLLVAHQRLMEGKRWRTAAWETSPFWIIALAAAVVTLLSQGREDTIRGYHEGLGGTAMAMLQVLAAYWGKLAVPVGLSNRYPISIPAAVWSPGVLAGVVVLAGSIALVCYWRRRWPLAAFCLLWFYITLLPVSNIVPIQILMAERYLYYAALGPFFLLALGYSRLREGRAFSPAGLRHVPYAHRRNANVALDVLLIALLAGYGSLTVARAQVWRDSVTLWEDNITKHPEHNAAAYNNLGNAYVAKGRNRDAAAAFRKAIEQDPTRGEAYNNLALTYQRLGEVQKALAAFRQGLETKAAVPEMLTNTGALLLQMGHPARAEALVRRALRLRPDFPPALLQLAVLYQQRGENAAAEGAFLAALKRDPLNAGALNNLGVLYKDMKRLPEAAGALQQALRLAPNSTRAHNNLGIVRHLQGKHAEALAHFRRSLALSPGYAEAYNNMGSTLAALDRGDEALSAYRRAVALKPDYANARLNLAVALLRRGRAQEARGHFAAFLAAAPGHPLAGQVRDTLKKIDRGAEPSSP